MKSLIATICILGLVGMVVGTVGLAQEEAIVAATVTLQQISVAVTPGVVSYGIVAAGESQDTVPDQTQTATNSGNITENLNIYGTVSSPGGWTLGGAAAGADVYFHGFSTDGGITPYTALTGLPQTLAAGVETGLSQTFDLQITTPPDADDTDEQSVNVIVQAVAP